MCCHGTRFWGKPPRLSKIIVRIKSPCITDGRLAALHGPQTEGRRRCGGESPCTTQRRGPACRGDDARIPRAGRVLPTGLKLFVCVDGAEEPSRRRGGGACLSCREATSKRDNRCAKRGLRAGAASIPRCCRIYMPVFARLAGEWSNGAAAHSVCGETTTGEGRLLCIRGCTAALCGSGGAIARG